MTMISKISTATLSIAAALAMSVSAFAADHKVEIKSFKFEPATLEVAVGDTVTFVNRDGAPHTGTAIDGSFDTGTLGKDDSGTITISSAGTFDYKCGFHPAMKGVITAK